MNKQDNDDSKLISILKNFGPDDITHKPFYPILVEMIQTLYLLPNCESGGLGHVIIDENNIDDGAIMIGIKQCKHERQRCEAPLVNCILEYMQRMTLAERAFMFYLIDEAEWTAFEFTDLTWFDLSKQKFFELLRTGCSQEHLFHKKLEDAVSEMCDRDKLTQLGFVDYMGITKLKPEWNGMLPTLEDLNNEQTSEKET